MLQRLGILAGCFACLGLADTLTLPSGYGTTEGPSYLQIGSPSTPTHGSHYQEVFSSSLFSALGPIEIYSISFRADVSNLLTSGTTDLIATMAATSAIPYSLSTQFAVNSGASPVIVYNAPYTFTTANTGTPKAFDITINFTTPFVYNPTTGLSLVFDFITSSAVFDGTNMIRLDAAFDSTVTGVSSLWGESTSTAGRRFDGGVLVDFGYNNVVPEPGTMGALGLGLLALAGYARRRQRDSR